MKNSLNYYFKFILLIIAALLMLGANIFAQSWQLWASGLPQGVFPTLSIAPNHDIYYGLRGTASTPGVIYKANTSNATGTFTAMPALPLPSSIQNNIQTIICNNNNEPIVGIFRNNIAEPFMFIYSNATSTWVPVTVDVPPSLGAFCFAKSPVNGDIYMGAKWSNVFRSTDGGNSFTHIDESSIVDAAYPCYYPAWTGNTTDGAIYSINVDNNGRVYAGTEGTGVLFSDDNGVSWHPADMDACDSMNPNNKDSSSAMKPVSYTGNVGCVGFTANNNLIWNGTVMWSVGWEQELGFADMTNHTTSQAQGFAQYFIGTGLQITKIVTTTNGQIFLHSGSNAGVPAGIVGIYTSTDGVNWTPFNTGITGLNDGQSQGSLAVDGNKVYMATRDGKVFVYDASSPTAGLENNSGTHGKLYPNPASDGFYFETNGPKSLLIKIYNHLGEVVTETVSNNNELISTVQLPTGNYVVVATDDQGNIFQPENLIIKK